MGTQSTFFGPIKFGILPDHLEEDELVAGNALIETGTLLAILGGTLLGGLAIMAQGGVALVSTLVILIAVAGWLTSREIPATPAASPNLVVGLNPLTETWAMLKVAGEDRVIFLCILGISWFWALGSTFLSLFPALAKDLIGADEGVVTLFLIAFSVGIALGALLCNRLLKGAIHATYVTLGSIGLTLFALDLYFSTRGLTPSGAELIGVGAFLAKPGSWRLLADMVAAGGLRGPLSGPAPGHAPAPQPGGAQGAQHRRQQRGQCPVHGGGGGGQRRLLSAGVDIPGLFLVLALVNAVVAVYILRLLPGALAKALIAWLLDLVYRVEVTGIKHVHEAGDRVVIVANHLSFLDAVLIAAYVPDDLTFAIDTHIAKHRLIRFFLSLAKTFPMDPTNPLAIRSLVNCVRNGEKVVIFPEGRLTVTGALMKVYEGPGLVADKAQAMILPVRLDGAQYTPFSRLQGQGAHPLVPQAPGPVPSAPALRHPGGADAGAAAARWPATVSTT